MTFMNSFYWIFPDIFIIISLLIQATDGIKMDLTIGKPPNTMKSSVWISYFKEA